MKKILLAFDGQHFSEGAFEFARRMHEKEPILLTGVFLPQVDFANLWSYADGLSGNQFIPLLESEDTEAVQKNIERFGDLCTRNNIEFRIHKDFFDFALPELKKETRFADLIVLGSERFYENLGTWEPNEYLKDALHAAECPVIIVPEKYEFPQSNILAYDGSESSVYAIKQFAYLFPGLAANKTLLVSVGENDTEFPEESYIKELTSRHFGDLEMFKLEINPKKYFRTWISGKDNAILVSGSFSRSAFSQLFKKSFVSEIIKDHRLPVFITHR
jgi:hypothetical protein